MVARPPVYLETRESHDDVASDPRSRVPATVLGLLHAEPDSELFWLERLRLADATPVILERRYIVAEYCPALTPAPAKGSLYALWTERYRLVISGADETIRAVTVGRPEAERLRMAPQAAGLLVTNGGT